jgi:NAD(P)-dependent dehydrogenase (short-subunit alcohol dehydrogenase family)
MKIRGEVAIVTGGASGLGAATAEELARAGALVSIWDLREEEGKALAERLGGRTQFLKTDVTSAESVSSSLEQAIAALGSPRINVNCAGILIGEKILGKKGVHDLDRFRKVIEVNLVGTFNVLRLVAEAMSRNLPDPEGERGVIVNTSSIAASEGQLGQSAYSASKAGIAGLTLPAARELAREGIRVCAISPGVFDTSMVAGMADNVRSALEAQIPFPSRLGRPREFAALVRAIVENPMLNGTVIRLDGGMRMSAR